MARNVAQKAQSEQDQDARVLRWIEDNIGPVSAIERQARWRPAWFVEASRQGKPLSLYVRGERQGLDNYMTVEGEGEILSVLERHGIPVPHVYGMIDDGTAVIMDRLPCLTGLANAADDAECVSVMDEYVQLLARIHAIDPAEFAALAAAVPRSAEEIALGAFARFERRYRAAKKRPEPFIEFAIRWLRRNVPRHREKGAFVLGDPGQFMFQDGRVTGVLNVELAYVGDIAHDLAGLRLRNIPEPFGDVNRVLRRYEEESGVPLDC